MNSKIQCTCGRYGCLEAYASATALMRQTREAMLENKDSKMWELCDGDINNVSGKTAFDGKLLGDPAATKVIENYVKYLGEGVINFVNIFRPEVVIFSGGVANQKEALLQPLRDYANPRVYGYPRTPHVELMIAELGYESGIIGAASLIL